MMQEGDLLPVQVIIPTVADFCIPAIEILNIYINMEINLQGDLIRAIRMPLSCSHP